MKFFPPVGAIGALTLCLSSFGYAGTSTLDYDRTQSCDVIIGGGSTAALAAALTSAREGAKTCLVEPVDWIGGQLTASAVPAIDYAWHKNREGDDVYDVGVIGKDFDNLPTEFADWMRQIGNPGRCWVSINCFNPKPFHDDVLIPTVNAEPNLRVFFNAVIKDVSTKTVDGQKQISEVFIVQRTLRPQFVGTNDPFLSEQVEDWYVTEDSARFTKETIRLAGLPEAGPVVIDATEWGDILVLSEAPYMQGVETYDGSTENLCDDCGQAFVYPFVIKYNQTPANEIDNPFAVPYPDFYSLGSTSWDRVWTYRRIIGNTSASAPAQPGDFSLQNWNPGNDYAQRYLFKNREETAQQRADWKGGIDIQALREGEAHAYGYYYWYKNLAKDDVKPYLSLDRYVLGTSHGLSKLPYIRDTRRSVGINNFVLSTRHMTGPNSALTGTRFVDRIAIGAYAVDLHPTTNMPLPDYILSYKEPLPFYIPFRSITNRDVTNLLVSGKTMAQSFLANASIRLQPIEWTTGIGSGAAAAQMVKNGLNDSRDMLAQMDQLQETIRKYAKLEWKIDGINYPQPSEILSPVPTFVDCPDNTRYDHGFGFCISNNNIDAYGPFTRTMTDLCLKYGGQGACTAQLQRQVRGRTLPLERWDKTFARDLRGNGRCPQGAVPEDGYCIERYTANNGVRYDEVYGPFAEELVEKCVNANGGTACYMNRWSEPFFRSLLAQ